MQDTSVMGEPVSIARCILVMAGSLLVIFALPFGIYMYAIRTTLGPILFDPTWYPGHGIHLSEAIATILILPLWIAAIRHFFIAASKVLERVRGAPLADHYRRNKPPS
jgi:hypothetical protein